MFGSTPTAGQSPPSKIFLVYISWYINDYGRPWTSSDVNPKAKHVRGQIAGASRGLHATMAQKASSPSLSDRTSRSRAPGGIVVSSLVSSACVRLRSWVFGLMRQCRSRTLTVFGELLSRLLKIGRLEVHTVIILLVNSLRQLVVLLGVELTSS
jgi:hypothetical protein